MIVWINGAFGSGKTQTAFELHRRIPNSYVYDPENVGFFIRKNVPSGLEKDDFQDFEMWREFNFSMLKYINDNYKGTIIVPMTVVNQKYFKDIVEKLRVDNIEVKHFVLWASKETLIKRLKSRAEGKDSWAANQIDRCMEGLSKDVFKEHIRTDNLCIEEVVEKIASLANLELLPDNRGRMAKAWHRIIVKLKHIRG
ncbi:Tunicamycin resistance protein [bioreactor metagenome]|uniref:Tunicamycin resistance protein n=1 Tax=bioreactor metagenome TaxID=1076179 RepID=A0A645DPW4_9ZZZZ